MGQIARQWARDGRISANGGGTPWRWGGARAWTNKNPAKERRGLKVGGLNEEPFSGLNLNW